MTQAAVLLAAGGASRFRSPEHKLLAPFRGRPLVKWALDAVIGAGLDEVIVVVGAVPLEHLIPGGVTVLDNEAWAEGQATSLRAAVRWAQMRSHEAVVVGLADMPEVTAEHWRAIADTEGDIVTATFRGERRPPVKLSADTWDLLPIGGDEGARGVMRLRPDLVREVSCEGRGIDVDTVEDLNRWS